MTEPEQIDVLAFSPHPDDAEIGCGGLLLLAAKEGLTTAIVDMSEGEKATAGTPAIRQKEKHSAAERLGLTVRPALGLPDTQIGQDPTHEGAIITCLREYRPRIVLAPYFEDRHPDHEEAARVIKRAVFFAGVARVGSGPPHQIERLLHFRIHQPFQPSLVFDVTRVWPDYQNVLAAYQSQFFQPGAHKAQDTSLNSGQFLQSLEVRARHYGAMINAEFGEPYYAASPLSFQSPSGLLRPRSAAPTYGSFSA
ncbi:MAG: bacillithiol biosynthesis deacetylase BshB1 [Alphaproteobacteria bacterium]